MKFIQWGGTQEDFWKWSELPMFKEISIFGSTLSFVTHRGQKLAVPRGHYVGFENNLFVVKSPEEIEKIMEVSQ